MNLPSCKRFHRDAIGTIIMGTAELSAGNASHILTSSNSILSWIRHTDLITRDSPADCVFFQVTIVSATTPLYSQGE
ncbi:hypothetical protein [Arcanobacterium ihumii]|uniref:hypothetical protein n=1 Tax=Arcanobacterium ihumii TaxID=2138162 RepID=UPI00135AD559|nr:hypothetical protein [Arcanobacterium ihumii]